MKNSVSIKTRKIRKVRTNRTQLTLFLFLGLLLLFSLFSLVACTSETSGEEADKGEIKTTPDGVKYIVDPSKILSGGPPKDGIPSIDYPQFVSPEEADKWLEDNELVLVFKHRGVTRVYPFQILVWHEIVNDTVAGDPVLITYCPLCGSGIAYSRKLNGEAVTFGTTGKLYNSNLVMYDRKTDTYWSQIDGRAIYGKLTGQRLKPLPIDTVVWGNWKKYHRNFEVLSRNTGYSRPYGEDPYGNYYTSDTLFFPVEKKNDALHPKAVVYGITVNGVHKAYPDSRLQPGKRVFDTVGGKRISIEKKEDGSVIFLDTDGGSRIVKERDFWFAWYAFHPDTLIYSN